MSVNIDPKDVTGMTKDVTGMTKDVTGMTKDVTGMTRDIKRKFDVFLIKPTRSRLLEIVLLLKDLGHDVKPDRIISSKNIDDIFSEFREVRVLKNNHKPLKNDTELLNNLQKKISPKLFDHITKSKKKVKKYTDLLTNILDINTVNNQDDGDICDYGQDDIYSEDEANVNEDPEQEDPEEPGQGEEFSIYSESANDSGEEFSD
jgi:hypothetical protein